MSPISALTSMRSCLCLIAIATLAVIMSGSIHSGVAGAATGGIGTTSGSSGHDTATKRVAGTYDELWLGLARRDRRWAHRTSECESGGNPRAIGGGGIYRGAFQFLKSTWRSSPKSPGATRSGTPSAPRRWSPSC